MLKQVLYASIIVSNLIISAKAVAEGNKGIGINLQSGSGVIYFPIDISDALRVEPTISYRKTTSDNKGYESQDLLNPSNESSEVERESRETEESTEFSIGIFTNKKLNEKSTLFYGARLGYIESNSDNRRLENDFFASGRRFINEFNSSSSGYSIAPTLSLEYDIVTNLAIAASIALNYTNIEGDTEDRFVVYIDDVITTNRLEKGSLSSTNTNTESSLNIRYYF